MYATGEFAQPESRWLIVCTLPDGYSPPVEYRATVWANEK